MPENTYVCTMFPHLVMNMNNARKHVCKYEVSTLSNDINNARNHVCMYEVSTLSDEYEQCQKTRMYVRGFHTE